VNVPLTTPEEAQAFLATMRDKSKTLQTASPKPPADLSGAGVDAWYMQQKQRELDMRKRRQEAESILRGYRATYDGMATPGGNHRDNNNEFLSPSGGRYMSVSPGIRAMMRETIEDPDSDVYEQRQRATGRLTIIEHTEQQQQQPQQQHLLGSHFKSKLGTNTDVRDDSCAKTPGRRETMNSAQKQAVPTPAKHMVPDETEWRDFIVPGTYCYNIYGTTVCRN
jgi:hypothetical protein